MKKVWLVPIALTLGAACFAQGYDPYYRGGRYNDRYDDRYRDAYGDRGNYDRGGDVVGRAIADLQNVRVGWYDHHDAKRVDKALHELGEFQDKLYRRNHWASGDLDSGIENLARVVDNGRIRGRDRQILYRDLMDLREFRASRGGYQGGYGYYRR